METRAHYVLVGAVTLIVVAAAFMFVLVMTGSKRHFDTYDIIFRDRVSGLEVGAGVSFNGIQKGTVKELKISPDDPSVVIARIQVDNDTPVKTDTKAELELVGFTGLAIIQLVGGSRDAPLLKDVTRGIPQIEADASGIAQLISGSSEIIASANRLLSEENTEAITRVIAGLDEVMSEVTSEKDNIGSAVVNAAKASESLAEASQRLNTTLAALDKIVREQGPDTIAEARATMKETRELVTELNDVVAENRDAIRVFTSQGLAGVAPAVTEARELFRSLDQVLREIDRDPRGYLLGESTPRYEGKQ
ncbi:MAG: MlaD family protein [Parvularculaceae bacterium]